MAAELQAQIPTQLVSDLLDFLKAVLPAGKLSEEFRQQLDQYTATLRSGEGAFDPAHIWQQCLTTGRVLLRQWEQEVTQREQEYNSLLDLLMETVHTVVQDNRLFHNRLSASNRRLRSYSELNDLQELRKHIAEELTQIERAIAEKQNRDTAQLVALPERKMASGGEPETDAPQIDELTSVYSRASFDKKIAKLVTHAVNFVLALFDIDDFRQLSAQHGEQVGQRVLITTVTKLQEVVRASDYIARYDNDQFAVMHIGSKVDHSLPRFSKLIKEIKATTFEYQRYGVKQQLVFSLSAGLTEFAPGDTVEAILARAHSALQQAKAQGKNRVLALKPVPIPRHKG
jgi:diguanylate cyclase